MTTAVIKSISRRYDVMGVPSTPYDKITLEVKGQTHFASTLMTSPDTTGTYTVGQRVRVSNAGRLWEIIP